MSIFRLDQTPKTPYSAHSFFQSNPDFPLEPHPRRFCVSWLFAMWSYSGIRNVKTLLGVFLFYCRISYGSTPGKPFRCVPSGGAGFTRPRQQKRFGDPRPSRSSRTSRKGSVFRHAGREINRVFITLRLPMRLSAICPTCPVSTLEIKGKAGSTSLSQLGLKRI
jgi:hypothetical protein